MAKAPQVSAAALLAALRRKQADLEAQDRAALKRQIELEHGGHIPVERPPPQPEVDRARELLNGSGDLLPGAPEQPEVELWTVINERKALRLALETLQKEDIRAGSLSLAEWMAAGGLDRWYAHQRRLANLLMSIQAEVVVGRDIRSEAVAASGGQAVQLPADRGPHPLLHPHAIVTLEAIKREGLLK